MILRDYQRSIVERVLASPARRTAIVLPTGGGKTFIDAELVRRWPGLAVLLCDREELAEQALAHFGEGAGLLIGGQRRSPAPGCPVVVGVYTAIRRTELPPASLVIVDEVHLAAAPTWRTVIGRYADARVIGQTATLYRYGGGSLRDLFDDVVAGPSVEELIAQGYLAPVTVYADPADVARGARVRAGEFVAEDLDQLLTSRVLRGAVGLWRQITGGNRRTIVFASNKTHARALVEEIGQGAEAVLEDTPREQRKSARSRLTSGELIALVSVNALGIGFDCPAAEVGLLCRPTMSRGVYRQQCGRPMRVSPGKAGCTIIDCAGNVGRHGLPTWPDVTTLESEVVAVPQRGRVLGVVNCEQCLRAYESTLEVCPGCGAPRPRQRRSIRTVPGTLEEVIGVEPTRAQEWARTASNDARIAWARKRIRRGMPAKQLRAIWHQQWGGWPPEDVYR